MEEATLRAKIQAMKNLLEAKHQNTNNSGPTGWSVRTSYGQRPTTAHRIWSRFPPSANQSKVDTGSANKVWKRQDATTSKINKSNTKRPMKITTNKNKSLQVLKLNDSEYTKANGGFSLVRAGAEKPVATLPIPVTRTSNNSVDIGGVKYVVANAGRTIKRCGTDHKVNSVRKSGSLNLTTKNGAAPAALIRARDTMQQPRIKRFQAKKHVPMRTVHCSFYNRFGYCTNKDKCRFIHDSRRVTMCRKFLKNECNDPKCLLSHQHDENKVPDCKMFLRGTCIRENCKYRHVKVSATAELCEPFTKGFCPKGSACLLRHELPRVSRKSSSTLTTLQKMSSSQTASGTSLSGATSGSDTSPASLLSEPSGSSKNDNTELSIRPNIRFTSKHSTGFPSLFDDLRRKEV